MKYCWMFLLLLVSLSVQAKDLNWKNVAILYAKLFPHSDYREYSEDYIRFYYPKKWKLYKNDEFLLEDVRPKFMDELKGKVAVYDVSESYTLKTGVEIGKYDFEAGEFPLIKGVSEQTYFPLRPKIYPSPKTFPREFRIFVENFDGIGGLEMSKEEARTFVSNRKSSSGRVDRDVSLVMNIRITKFKSENSFQDFYATVDRYSYEFE